MSQTRARYGPWCALLVASALGAVSLQAQDPPAGVCDAAIQEAPLDFTLQDVNGDAVNLASYRRHAIVLSFWATWCLPCRTEIPRLIKLQDRYRAKGLTVVGLSLDTDLQKVREYARRMGMNYPIFMIGRDHAVEKAYAPLWGLPSTVLVRRDGLICRRQIAFVADRDLENRIQGLLHL